MNFEDQIAELERGAHEVLVKAELRQEAQARHAAAGQGGLRSDRAGPAPRAHGAAQQDAPVPAARPRGDLPHRGLHRPDRRPERAQRHAPGAHARGDPGERPHLRDAGVQDPRPASAPASTSTRAGSASCTAADIVRLAAQYTVARMLERDDFAKRYKGGPADLHPRVPLPAGAGLRLGGAAARTSSSAAPTRSSTCWSGRTLQEAYGQEPQVVMTMPLLEGTDGVNKMSKSLGNYIGITEAARQHVRQAHVDLGRAHVALLRAAVVPAAGRDRGAASARPARAAIRATSSSSWRTRSSRASTTPRRPSARSADFMAAGEREGGARRTCR